MKLNKSKLKNQQFYLLGGEIKGEQEFMQAVNYCIQKIKRGQSSRQENTLNETWGIDDLEKLINCIEIKY